LPAASNSQEEVCIVSPQPGAKSRPKGLQPLDEIASEEKMAQVISEHRDHIEAKLRVARESIAHGRTAPLEPLSTLLREARRRARTSR
jgi:hypothetical protein